MEQWKYNANVPSSLVSGLISGAKCVECEPFNAPWRARIYDNLYHH